MDGECTRSSPSSPSTLSKVSSCPFLTISESSPQEPLIPYDDSRKGSICYNLPDWEARREKDDDIRVVHLQETKWVIEDVDDNFLQDSFVHVCIQDSARNT